MNKIAAQKLIQAREQNQFKQREMAEMLAKATKQTYSIRQYQKLEEGKFPKFKSEIVTALDKILGTNLYSEIYEQKVPHETSTEQTNVVEENGVHYHAKEKDPQMEVLQTLARSNDKLSQAILISAKNQENIISRLPGSTANGSKGIPLELEVRLSEILELIADVGTGKKWNSKAEAIEELNKFVIAQR